MTGVTIIVTQESTDFVQNVNNCGSEDERILVTTHLNLTVLTEVNTQELLTCLQSSSFNGTTGVISLPLVVSISSNAGGQLGTAGHGQASAITGGSVLSGVTKIGVTSVAGHELDLTTNG